MAREAPVVVATDFSPSADEAIRQADACARLLGSKLVACHVIPNLQRSAPLFPQCNVATDLALPQVVEACTAALAARITDLTDRQSRGFEVLITDGSPDAEIVRLGEELGARVIVVGSHGTTGIERMLLGRTAERVVRYAHGPVRVARAHKPTGHVLVATDFSDPALPAVAAAAEEARLRRARLTIMHSVDLPLAVSIPLGGIGGPPAIPITAEMQHEVEASARARLSEALARHAVDGELLVAHGPPGATIVRAAEELAADLVVVGTVGRSGIKRLVLGSVAESVVRHAPCSVLVVRLHEQS